MRLLADLARPESRLLQLGLKQSYNGFVEEIPAKLKLDGLRFTSRVWTLCCDLPKNRIMR
jgi:hypothetical protein